MNRIPMQTRGKRPRFFPEAGQDESISMMLELLSEVWMVRERLYALEKVAAKHGLDLTPDIEEWRPDEDEAAELAQHRRQMIQSMLRSVEARHVPGTHLRRTLDAIGDDPNDKQAEIDHFKVA